MMKIWKLIAGLVLALCALSVPAAAQFNVISRGPLAGFCNSRTLGLDVVNNVIYSCGDQVGNISPTWSPAGTGGGGGGGGCTTNPADGGCALTGTPSIDLFIGAIGPGTGWLSSLINSSLTLKVPLVINSGTNAGVISVGCGPDPGTGSFIGIAAPASCTPYTIYLPTNASSGYFQLSASGNKLTLTIEGAINLGTSDVTGTNAIVNGGTGATTGSGAMVNIFPTPVRVGDLIYWNAAAWNNFPGCNVSTCIYSENGAGNPGWIQTPIPVVDGGYGLVTQSAGAIYKGNGASAPTVSALSDDGTNVTSTEPVKISNPLIGVAAPTISSGFGTSPSIVNSNGPAAFSVNVGTGGSASSGVIGLPTAAHAWNCTAFDITSPTTGGGFMVKQTAGTASSATLTGYNLVGTATAWTASDVLYVSCLSF